MPRAVEQVGAVEVEHVEEERRDARRRCSHRRCATRSPGTAAAGRRRRARAPRRRARVARPGRARTTATTSGSRSVMSSRLRVATSDVVAAAGGPGSGCRRAWCRPPRLGRRRPWPWRRRRRARWTPASAAPAGRPRARTRPARPRRRSAPRPTIGTVPPASIAARRTAVERHARGGRERLLHQRVEGALADVAGDHAAQPALLVGGGPTEQVAHRRGPRRPATRPGQRRPGGRTSRATSSDGQRRLVGRLGRRAEPRQPTPVRRWSSEPPR